MSHRAPLLLLLLLASSACDSPGDADAGPSIDGGGHDAGDSPCQRDSDCSDQLFCNGVERCLPGDEAADARGCVSSSAPCLESQTCDDAADRCVTECAMGGDADGDNHAAIECGGDDCDDSDPDRFPGNPEVCDDRDNDCDDRTLAGWDGDQDGDGYVSSACCVPDPFGAGPPICGRDCDDTASGVNPGTPEACNGIDDDCSGAADEGLLSIFYPDDDNDLFGRDADAVTACARPQGYAVVGGDCDDGDREINPARVEVCDVVDQDCDDAVDEDSSDLGTDDHCSACGDACQFGCSNGECAAVVSMALGGGLNGTSIAALDDGRTYAWGNNLFALMLREAPNHSLRPIPALLAPGELMNLSMGPGARHVCASADSIFSTENAYCWGRNTDGQLGTGSSTSFEFPSRAHNLRGAVSAGGRHSCGRSGSGVVCWGDNSSGQLGTSDLNPSLTPVVVQGENDPQILRPIAGFRHTCGIALDGTVRCWGHNFYGQTGSPPSGPQPAPNTIPGLADVEQLALGGDFTCARTSTGTVRCWGNANNGRLGDGVQDHPFAGDPEDNERATHQPGTVVGIDDAVDLSAGTTFACVVRQGGEVWCWGEAGLTGQALDSFVPARLAGLGPASAVYVGDSHSCAILVSGDEVWCWGINSGGQLGNGTVGEPNTPQSMPTQIIRPSN